MDILGAARSADDITWWENTDGTGTTWAEHTVDGEFDGADEVYAADVDGDGDTDILGAAVLADDITWWENTNGAGTTWAEHTVDGDFDFAVSVHAADVDGDGDTDVLGAALFAGKITWWENTGACTGVDGVCTNWTEHTVDGAFDGAASVYAADVDGDGDTDVLGAANSADAVVWWENTDDVGTTWTEHTVDEVFDGLSVYAADVDGDGDADVLGAAFATGDITWWENANGAGTSWTEHTVDGAFSGAGAVYAADVDGDGDTDVLGAAQNADDITWWENTDGTGTNWIEYTVDGSFDGAPSVYAADVDGDGDTDVLGASQNADDIAWWENTAIHRSACYRPQSVISTAAAGATSVYAADVDGDGDIDTFSASSGDNKIAWYENTDGQGNFGPQQVITTAALGATSVYAADVDGDGDLDVLSASTDGEFYEGPVEDKIAWYENTDGQGNFGPQQVITTAALGAASVYAADVDGDGDTDALSASLFDAIYWYENTTGDGSAWTAHVITFSSLHSSVYAADVDGDGDIDALSASQLDDNIAWYENTDGDGSAWTAHVITVAALGATSVYAADVDGDGDIDTFSASWQEDKIAWYENTDGDGSVWTQRVINTPDLDGDPFSGDNGDADSARSVYAADVDGDGDIDTFSASSGDNKIAWYENTDGQGNFGPQQVITNAALGAASVYAADVDGDGDLDALSASRSDDKIAWYKNDGGQFALETTNTAPTTFLAGQMDDVLKAVVTHRGRAGDTDVELATFDLLFEESAGDPLASAEANALIENLHIYLDDGSGTFESGADTLVTTVGTLALTSGVQTVAFTDGDPNVAVAFGTPKTYFVVVELTADAASLAPNQFRVTHVAEGSSTAEDRDNDIPLSPACPVNVASAVTTAEWCLNFDGDEVVDVEDIATIGSAWRATDANSLKRYDFISDGVVNIKDIMYGTTHWAEAMSCTPPPASEGWVTILEETFEGDFPGGSWDVVDNSSTGTGYVWGKRDCRAFAGTHSGWGGGGGSAGASFACGSDYPNDLNSWMVYGPFSLANATAADLAFKLWLNSETDFDTLFWGASTDATNFSGIEVSGNSGGWIDETLDVANVPTLGNLTGEPSVWIALVFSSDGDISEAEGAYVDNIVLRKFVSSATTTGSSGPARQSVTTSGTLTRTPSHKVLTR